MLFTQILMMLIYLGFAWLWGRLFTLRIGLAVVFGLLLMLPAALLLPLPAWLGVLLGAAVGATAARQAVLPAGWRLNMYHYWAVVMFLILLWALATGSGWVMLAVGAPAGAAGLAVLWRLVRTPHCRGAG